MKVPLEIIVRSTEIDLNGHVNNAKYLEYMEWGREEWYEQAHLPYQEFLDLGIQTVTVNININYKKECVYGDRLTVWTSPKRIGRTSYVLYQEVINQNGDIVADAEVTMVTMDHHIRKSTSVPERLAQLFRGEE